MGEKHNTWRASWIPALLVVVRTRASILLTQNIYFFLAVGFFLLFFNHFLHLVHSVFWDLYCAAPERRETCDHSSEAKAFHDYVSSVHEDNCCSKHFFLFYKEDKEVVKIRIFLVG